MNIDGVKLTVKFHGSLAGAVGRPEWTLFVSTFGEALSAVDTLSDGSLVRHLSNNLFSAYHILFNGKSITDTREMSGPAIEGVLELLPVLKGSDSSKDSGAILTIIGIVIIAIVLIVATSGTGAPALGAYLSGTATLSSSASFFLTLGLAITLTGISNLLAPSSAVDTSERPENKPSYILNGAINTYRQGNPVQAGFGVLEIGSQVIYAGVRNVDYADATDQYEYDFIETVYPINPSQDYPSQQAQLEVPNVIQTNDPSSLSS